MTREFKFGPGDEVIEKITGYTGTITAACFYLTGCNQYGITSKSVDNKEPLMIWYDEGRLELIKNRFSMGDVTAIDNGCDIKPPIGRRGN